MLAHLILSHSFVPSICFDMLPPECLISSSSSSLGVIYCPCMFFLLYELSLFAWFHFFSHLVALIIITKSSVLVYNKMAAAAVVRLLSLVCGGHVSLVVSFISLFFGFLTSK